MERLSDHRDLLLFLFCGSLLSLFAALFWGTCAWRSPAEFTRLALTVAIVDQQTFIIDGYIHTFNRWNTFDMAYYQGHYYTDKAIGMSVFIIPGFLVGKVIYLATGGSVWAYVFWTSLCCSIQMAWVSALLPVGIKRLLCGYGYEQKSGFEGIIEYYICPECDHKTEK